MKRHSSETPTESPAYEFAEARKPEGSGFLDGGERFNLDTASGSPRLEIPIPGPEARGLAPSLKLAYRGGTENGIFGLGVALDLPSISRRTVLGIPSYNSSDQFVTESGDVLTPRRDLVDGAWQLAHREEILDGMTYRVTAYRRRIESSFDRIEFWEGDTGAASFWIITDQDNITSVFGRSDAGRIAGPGAPERIFRWAIEERTDPKGNRIAYSYDRDRTAEYASLYPAAIAFAPFTNEAGSEEMAFRYVFEYGDAGKGDASPRPDIVVSFRPGFELRVARRCEAIGLEHYFPENLGPVPVRVQDIRFTYKKAWDLSLLETITRVGIGTSQDPAAEKKTPRMKLGFTEWRPQDAAFAPLRTDPPSAEPFATEGGDSRFVDLLGEGVPGVLGQASEPGRAYYWPPQGCGKFGSPAPLPTAPVSALELPTRHALLDLSGVGTLDAVTLAAGGSGYFANNGDGTWMPFQTFQTAPVDLGEPAGAFVDLRGAGRPDFLVNGPAQWRANDCLGRAGYSQACQFAPPDGTDVFDDGGEAALMQFANIFGDGLSHLVRVSSGCVRIWPNLGGGRFGPPRDAPIGTFPDSVTTKDILLADLTGAGGADICVFGPEEVAFYQNHYGLRFSLVRTVPLPIGNSLINTASAADLDGIGVSRIVIGSVDPNDEYWSLDAASGTAPFLLNRIDNGMGRETELTYRSSASFYFAARATGNPWLIRSPFPVNVVESVFQRDSVSGANLIRFAEYRDGFFDPVDRQFAGFGYTQMRDHPAMDAHAWLFRPEAKFAVESVEPGVEPLFTRSWSLIGDLRDAGRLRAAMLRQAYHGDQEPLILPAPHFDPAIEEAGPEAVRLAWRALFNYPIRSEAFPIGEDGTIQPVPFNVDQSAFAVRLIQPPMGSQPAVVLVLARETVHTAFEGQASDPQTSHTLNTAFDAFGQPTRHLTVGYARFAAPGCEILPDQKEALLRLTTRGLINHVDGAYQNASGGTEPPLREKDDKRDHFIGLPFDAQSFDLAGFPQPAPYLTYEGAVAIVDACMADVLAYGEPFTDGSQARVGSWTRTIYWNCDRTGPESLQRLSPQDLVHHTAKAVFSGAFVERYYGNKVDPALLSGQGGYRQDGAYWWWPGLVAHFGGPGQYFLLVMTVDPFGAETRMEYDRYNQFVAQRTNALSDVMTAVYDYRALLPARVVDENLVTTEFAFDPLGEVLLRTIYGFEDGVVVGDLPLSDYKPITAPSPEAVLAAPADYLQGAGSFFFYDLEAWSRDPQLPPFTLELERRRYARPPSGENAPDLEAGAGAIAVTLRFYDGAGRDLASAELVSGEPPFALFGDSSPRLTATSALSFQNASAEWLIVNQVRYDERGDVVTRYQPYFASVPAYRARPDAAHWTLWYDGLHREIDTETTKGFLTRTEYAAWSQTHWDEDDLVKESPYYIAHINDPDTSPAEKEALRQAARFENTPKVSVRDVLGRMVQTIEYLVGPPESDAAPRGEELATYAWYDGQDRETAFADARFYNPIDPTKPEFFNYFVIYDMLGRGVWQKNADSGDLPLRKRDDGIPQVRLLDGDGIPVVEWNRRGYRVSSAYNLLRDLTEVRITGLDLDIVTQRLFYGTQQGANTVNRLIRTMDQAGVVQIASYSIQGQPLTIARQFTTDPADPADWRDPAEVRLQDKVWICRKGWNALSEQIGVTAPNGARTQTAYTANGWARAVALEHEGVFGEIAEIAAFAPDGRPHRLDFPGAVSLDAEYDPATLRMKSSVARTELGATLLALEYTYDPMGNVTSIADGAPVGGGQPEFRVFRYDSLYRLRYATGRRQAQPGTGPITDYARTYDFDQSGNLTARLDDGGPPFSTVYVVSPSSNHAITEAMAGKGGPDTYFDADGLMTELPDGAVLAYDPLGELGRVRTALETASYQYSVDGERARKNVVPVSGDARKETDYIDSFIAIGGAGGRAELVLRLNDDLAAVVHYPSAASTAGATIRAQLSDRIRSVAYEVAADGATLSGQAYYPFGETAVYETTLGDPISDKRYQFVGREKDPESGLYHFRARSYSPVLARWIAPDPAGTIDGSNLFAYVQGNPVSRTDPSGQNGKDGDKQVTPVDAVAKGLKKFNYGSFLFNLFGEALGSGIHAPISQLTQGKQFIAAQSLAFSGFAAWGGLFGVGYYTLDIRKNGLNYYNAASLAGNVGAFWEGVKIYSLAFITNAHALHLAHQRIGRIGMYADILKIPKEIKDKKYGVAGIWTSLAVTNWRASVTYEQALSRFTSLFKTGASIYNVVTPKTYAKITAEQAIRGATRAAGVPGWAFAGAYIGVYHLAQAIKSEGSNKD